MEKIIELVRKYPILYDLSHEDYKNIRKKDKVWSKIGEEIGENGDEIKKKWRNLRDTYAKYIRTNKTKTGQAANNTKKWIWADHMEAFKPFLNFAKTSSNVSDVYSQESTAMTNMEPPESGEMFETFESEQTNCSQNLQETQSGNSQKSNTDIVQVQPSELTPTSSAAPKVTPALNAPVIHKANRKRNSESSTSVKDMITYFESKKRITYDATDQLFLAHASTIKTFSPRRQIEAKMKIAQVIMEMELLQLEESSSNSHQSRPASTDTYPNISSVESISVASLGSHNDVAFPRQSETSEYYERNSENSYITLSNQAHDFRDQPASKQSSTSNYLNSFNPYSQ